MGRAQRLAVLARAWLVLVSIGGGLAGWLAPSAQAQADHDATAPGSDPADDVADSFEAADSLDGGLLDGPGGISPAGTPAVVFMSPADEETLGGDELRNALLAQFALVDAHLRFAETTPTGAEGEEGGTDLAVQLARARELADRHDAVAVFWIGSQPGGRWVLHMMDPRGDRLAMRTVDADEEARSAAVEAIAVITRESTRALLAGLEVESQPLPPTAPPAQPTAAQQPAAQQPASSSVPATRHVTRLALGYEGTEFANSRFQNGLALAVSVRGPAHFYGGVGLTWTSNIEVASPLAFEISRLPIRAHAGYRHELVDLRLDVELGLGLDVLSRETASEQPRIPTNVATVSPSGDSTKLIYSLSPRVRAELSVLPALGLYAAAGLDILLNNFSYVSDSGEDVVLLRPRRARVLIGVGVAFYP